MLVDYYAVNKIGVEMRSRIMLVMGSSCFWWGSFDLTHNSLFLFVLVSRLSRINWNWNISSLHRLYKLVLGKPYPQFEVNTLEISRVNLQKADGYAIGLIKMSLKLIQCVVFAYNQIFLIIRLCLF